MNAVFAVDGMQHFGKVVSEALGWPLFVQTYCGKVDTVYIVGMYDPPTYGLTLDCTKHAKRRIIHWCGSDVAMLADASMLPEATHLAETQGLADELREKGVDAHVVTFPTLMRFPVTPLPPDPIVSFYGGTSPELYGESIVRALADVMPEVTFNVYGYGQYKPSDMPRVVAGSRVYLRLAAHDGSANSAREFMEGGRRVITTADLPFATRVRRDDVLGIASAIRKALREDAPDAAASAHYSVFNSPDRYLKEVGEYL